jgi:hypothetical protein
VKRLEELLGPQGTELETFMSNRGGMTPDETDLSGTAASILRLQRTYNRSE